MKPIIAVCNMLCSLKNDIIISNLLLIPMMRRIRQMILNPRDTKKLQKYRRAPVISVCMKPTP